MIKGTYAVLLFNITLIQKDALRDRLEVQEMELIWNVCPLWLNISDIFCEKVAEQIL